MTHYVLVAGAWLGSWAWDEVVPELRAAGHEVTALTLSGLAEKREVRAGLETHVQDVVEAVVSRDLREVVLVGHSYAGIPVGQAAERIGDRLSRVVFVDSNIPEDGESFLSSWPEGRPFIEASMAENDGNWAPLGPERFEGQELDEQQVARILARSTPHPGATLVDPAKLSRPVGELPATYLQCLLSTEELMPTVAAEVAAGRWRLATLETGHWPMFSRPTELAGLLLAEAATAGD
ncbi:alpha/beta fold hydrolase [Streptomyces sp. NPDC097619]|uniref:alpha/beta fold hydrolase n=1 Tax=Streptomyces sp. NPDC097619 TaxID=3157228 RepID=UPI0033193AF7